MALTVGALHVMVANRMFDWLCCFKTKEAMLDAKRQFAYMSDEQAELARHLACECGPCPTCPTPGQVGPNILPPGPNPNPPPGPSRDECVRGLIAYACTPAGKKAIEVIAGATHYAKILPIVIEAPILGQVLTGVEAALKLLLLGCEHQASVQAIADSICFAAGLIKQADQKVIPLLGLISPILPLLDSTIIGQIRRCCNV